jgi:predicted ATPase
MQFEIRPSEITELSDKVKRQKYNQYLYAIHIGKLRGLSNIDVRFDFPVTAIIGPNCGGKSTILGSAACAYKETKPRDFFPKSAIGDDSMSEWSAEYEILDRNKGQNGHSILRRKILFRELRWMRKDILSRDVSYFGIGRTIAVNERPEFKKLKNPAYSHQENMDAFSNEVATQIEHILGKSISGFRKTKIASGGSKIFHVGKNQNQDYSEFHFGAGESSIIRIVDAIESKPDHSLILIEELENGLHPVATRRLVEYLIFSARQKHNQVIFTTHSDVALAPLPSDAIWSCYDGRVQQGKLSVNALRSLTGKIDKKLAVFVEDEFAKIIVEIILQTFLKEKPIIDQVEVHSLGGDGTAVKIFTNRKHDPTTSNQSLCIIDGDSRQHENPSLGILRLPGSQPDATVFQGVETNLDNNIARLTIALHLQSLTEQSRVREVIRKIAHTCRDPHLYFAQIGEELGNIPEQIVQRAFVSLWVQENVNIFNQIVSTITKLLAVSDDKI